MTGVCILGLAHPALGDLVVAELFNDRLVRYDEVTGDIIAGWEIVPGDTGLLEPSGVTLGPTGDTLFVSSRLTGEVLWFDAATGAPLVSPHDGGHVGLFATLPDNPPLEEGGDPVQASPGQLKFGPDGNLYVADNGGANVRIIDGTDGTNLGDAAGGLFAGGGLTFTDQGDLLVSDFAAGAIYKVDGDGQSLLVNFNLGGLQTPNAVLVTPAGEILASDLFGNQIMQFSADGLMAEQFAVIPPAIPDPLPDGAQFPSNFPSDLLLAPNGSLLVGVLGITNPDAVDDDRGSILRYNFNGELIETLTEFVSPVSAMALVPAVQPVPGDYDGDGTVGPEEYDEWVLQFGQSVAIGSGADGNADGVVNAADYVFWRNVVDASAQNDGSGAAVPEPTSLLLMLTATLSLLLAGRGRPTH